MTTAGPSPCDAATVLAKPGGASDHPRWVLTATICASSLAFIDSSVVNVALPSISRSFSADAAQLQWTINAYLLPLSALLLLGGAAGDHFGRRRLLILGTALFAVASAFCALAMTPDMLLAARALQGVGAAMLMPNSLAVLGDAFQGEARGQAIGAWAAIGAIASAVGPPLGGWLVDAVGWRVIFLINLPLAAAAILTAWKYVVESERQSQPLDWLGAGLATAALGALTWALTLWSGRQAMSTGPAFGAAGGLILLLLFVWHQRRRGERAMMPLSLFASRSFVGLTLTTFLLYGALGGLLVLLPYVLIQGGYSPLEAGLSLMPLPVGIGLASRLMGRATANLGPRWPLSLGPLVAAGGFVLLTRVDPQASYWTSVLPGAVLLALGMAGAVAPLTTAVLASVDARHTGLASGFNSAIARTGGLIATALAGAVMVEAGQGLLQAFHLAALVGAVLAAASGLCSWFTLDGLTPGAKKGAMPSSVE